MPESLVTLDRNTHYDEATRQALIMLWEAANRVCGKRLKALVPMLTDAMERHGHIDLDPIGARQASCPMSYAAIAGLS